MSWIAAPVGDVTTPIFPGRKGNGRTGVFEVRASYWYDPTKRQEDMELKVPLWAGSLRSNPVKVALIPEATWTRLKAMRAAPESFDATLSYSGPQDKPFYTARLMHRKLQQREVHDRAFRKVAFLGTAEVLRLIDTIAMNERLWHADGPTRRTPAGYNLVVRWGRPETIHAARILLDLETLRCLREMNAALDAAHRKPIDMVLGRLSGYERWWKEAEQKRRAVAREAADEEPF